jgi:hypothetical protein
MSLDLDKVMMNIHCHHNKLSMNYHVIISNLNLIKLNLMFVYMILLIYSSDMKVMVDSLLVEFLFQVNMLIQVKQEKNTKWNDLIHCSLLQNLQQTSNIQLMLKKVLELFSFVIYFIACIKEKYFLIFKSNEFVFCWKIMISLSSFCFTWNVLSLKSISSITMLLIKIKIKNQYQKKISFILSFLYKYSTKIFVKILFSSI